MDPNSNPGIGLLPGVLPPLPPDFSSIGFPMNNIPFAGSIPSLLTNGTLPAGFPNINGTGIFPPLGPPPGFPNMTNADGTLDLPLLPSGSTNFTGMFPPMPPAGAAGGNPSDTRTYEGVEAVNIIQIFICTIGLIANMAVILSVLILKELKKGITVWYILQLAIADTLFLITIPFQVLEDQNAAWIYPEWLCKAKQTVMYINYYASISFLTVMAFDRYIAVCHIFSENLPKLRSRKSAYIITVIVWSICILISIPAMLSSAVQGPKPNCKCGLDFRQPKTIQEKCAEISGGDEILEAVCLTMPYDGRLCADMTPGFPGLGPVAMGNGQGTSMQLSGNELQLGCHYQNHPYAFKVFTLVNLTVMFLLPLSVIAVCYALIIRHLRKSTFRGDGGNSGQESQRRKKRVIIMCITLVAVFTACWLPYHAQHLAKFVGMPGRSSSFCERLSHVTSLIVYLNSAINPFIYFIIARLKSHVSNITRSRAASAVLTLFSRNGQRTMTTRQTTNRSEKSKGDTRSTEGKVTTEARSHV